LQRAQPQLLAHHATVLGVTYRDAAPDSQAFVRRLHLSYPNLRDSTGGFAGAYGTDQLPETFLIDREGRVVAVSRGEIGQPFVNRALALAQGA
jgi:cytochrome c biogenesis protein CcmG/thiol:disulfide interchange protein DsbE